MNAASGAALATCLGCGCGCDDVAVRVHDGRIAEITPPCSVGRRWFGDGAVPSAIRRAGSDASLEDAITDAAELLAAVRGSLLVVLAADVSLQAHRAAIALADLLRADVRSVISEPAATGLLVAQRRGRAGATLGEIRNRADVLLFWGVDPAVRYPRYLERYVPDSGGTHVAAGRAARTMISVGIGTDRGPAGADLAIVLEPGQEVTALSMLRAAALGHEVGEVPEALRPLADVASRLTAAKYAVVVHEAEPGEEPTRDRHRSEGLIALVQALNGPIRAALSTLRAGGNRSGAEAALTWQTGYPMAVSFRTGVPVALTGLAGEDGGRAGAMLIAGSASSLGSVLTAAAGSRPVVLVGPRASEAPFPTRVAIDTGVAGIHNGGTAYRMDEVSLPLRPPVSGPRDAAGTLELLLTAVRGRQPKAHP